MSELEIVTLMRGLERMLIVFCGGTSLVLGWHLFKSGVNVNQRADFKGKGFSANFERVGPGVFFAFFGASVLGFSTWSTANLSGAREPLVVAPEAVGTPHLADASRANEADEQSRGSSVDARATSEPSDGSTRAVKISYLGGGGKMLQIAKAINSVSDVTEAVVGDCAVHPTDKELLAVGVSKLASLRDSWVVEQYGLDALVLWKEQGERYLLNPSQIAARKRETLDELRPWMAGTIEIED